MQNKVISIARTFKSFLSKSISQEELLEEQLRMRELALACAEEEECEINSKTNIIKTSRDLKCEILDDISRSNLNKQSKEIAQSIVNDIYSYETEEFLYYRILAQHAKEMGFNNEYNKWLYKSISCHDSTFQIINMPKYTILENKIDKYGLNIFPTIFEYPKQEVISSIIFNIDNEIIIDAEKNMFFYLLNLLPEKLRAVDVEIRINEKMDVGAHVINEKLIEFRGAWLMNPDTFCHELGHVLEKYFKPALDKICAIYKVDRNKSSFNLKLKNIIRNIPILLAGSLSLIVVTDSLFVTIQRASGIIKSPVFANLSSIFGFLSLINIFFAYMSKKQQETGELKYKYLTRVVSKYDNFIYKIKNHLIEKFKEISLIETEKFPSNYAKYNECELFAELIEAYILYGDAMRAMPRDSLVYQVYEVLKTEVFEDIEYTRNEFKLPIVLNK